jgi:hypothetical protein
MTKDTINLSKIDSKTSSLAGSTRKIKVVPSKQTASSRLKLPNTKSNIKHKNSNNSLAVIRPKCSDFKVKISATVIDKMNQQMKEILDKEQGLAKRNAARVSNSQSPYNPNDTNYEVSREDQIAIQREQAQPKRKTMPNQGRMSTLSVQSAAESLRRASDTPDHTNKNQASRSSLGQKSNNKKKKHSVKNTGSRIQGRLAPIHSDKAMSDTLKSHSGRNLEQIDRDLEIGGLIKGENPLYLDKIDSNSSKTTLTLASQLSKFSVNTWMEKNEKAMAAAALMAIPRTIKESNTNTNSKVSDTVSTETTAGSQQSAKPYVLGMISQSTLGDPNKKPEIKRISNMTKVTDISGMTKLTKSTEDSNHTNYTIHTHALNSKPCSAAHMPENYLPNIQSTIADKTETSYDLENRISIPKRPSSTFTIPKIRRTKASNTDLTDKFPKKSLLRKTITEEYESYIEPQMEKEEDESETITYSDYTQSNDYIPRTRGNSMGSVVTFKTGASWNSSMDVEDKFNMLDEGISRITFGSLENKRSYIESKIDTNSESSKKPQYISKPGISFKEFCDLLTSDSIFLDYFNKFLVLPIFGQTIYYDKLMKDFSIYPSINDNNYYIDDKRLKKFLYTKRFVRFIQTPYYLEYRLNIELSRVQYLKSDDPLVCKAFDFLKNKFLAGVSRMRSFRKFLLNRCNNQEVDKNFGISGCGEGGNHFQKGGNEFENDPNDDSILGNVNNTGVGGSTSNNKRRSRSQKFSTGYIIYNFWIDALNLRLNIEQYSDLWYKMFINMRQKYGNPRSPMYVPTHIRIGDACFKDQEKWDIEFITKMSEKFLLDLQNYWVPRYIMDIKQKKLKGSDLALFSLAKKHLKICQIVSPNLHKFRIKAFELMPKLECSSTNISQTSVGLSQSVSESKAVSISEISMQSSLSEITKFSSHAESLASLLRKVEKKEKERRNSQFLGLEIEPSDTSVRRNSNQPEERRLSVVKDDHEEWSDEHTKSTDTIDWLNTSQSENSFEEQMNTNSEIGSNAPGKKSSRASIPGSILSKKSMDNVSVVSKHKKKTEPASTGRNSNLEPIKEEAPINKGEDKITCKKIQRSSVKSRNKKSKLASNVPSSCNTSIADNKFRALKSEKDADEELQSVYNLSKAMTYAIKTSSGTSLSSSDFHVPNMNFAKASVANIAHILDNAIEKMSTLAMMNRVRSQNFQSEIEVTVAASNTAQREKTAGSKVNVKASTNYMKQRASGIMQDKSKVSFNASTPAETDGSSSSAPELETFTLALGQAGKSDVKKIKQHRKTNTFAFSINDVGGSPGETDEEKEDDYNIDGDKKSKSKSPVQFNLNKEAIFRATKNKAKEKKKKWDTGKKPQKNPLKKKKIPKITARRRQTLAIDDVLGSDKWMRASLIDSITMDDEKKYRRDNFRKILAFQIDEYAGFPFREWLYEEGELDLLKQLSIWLDIERLRRTTQYASDLSTPDTYRTYYDALLKRYIMDENQLDGVLNPFLRSEILNLNTELIFDIPKAWIRFQRDLLETLTCVFDEFIILQRTEFMDACMRTKHGLRKKSVCFSMEEPMEDQETTEMPNITTLSLRMIRAGQFLIDMSLMYLDYNDSCVSPFSGPETRQPEFSDDNGDIKEEIIPVRYVNVHYWKTKELTAEEVFAASKLEYPKKGDEKVVYKVRTEVNYMRSIRRNGMVINRPSQRPKSMKDILKNQTYFEFFKKYLKYFNVERMLVFWKAVEIMKNTVNVKQRQSKAQHIMEKYFHDPDKTPAEMLYCSAPIILEIPNLEIVTTSMLYSAQQTILQKIEVNWFRRFTETFPEKENKVLFQGSTPEDNKRETLADNIGFNQNNDAMMRGLRATICFNATNSPFRTETGEAGISRKSKLFRSWIALSNWFRAAAKFIQCMHKREEYNLFSSFLQRVGKKGIPGTTTDSQGNILNSLTDLHKSTEKEPTTFVSNFVAKQVICGQLITLSNLQHDLDFWIETDRFKELYNKRDGQGTMENIQNGAIQKKATIINDLFLQPTIWLANADSDYLNVPKDICENISGSIDSGIIDKTIFIDAVSYIFPVLIYFWKIYRESYAVTVYNKWTNLAAEIKRVNRGTKSHRKTVHIRDFNAKRKPGETEFEHMQRLRRQRLSIVPVLNKQLHSKTSEHNKLTFHGRKLYDEGECILVGKNLKITPSKRRQSFIDQKEILGQPKIKSSNIDDIAIFQSNNPNRSESANTANTVNFIGSKITYSQKEGIILHVHPKEVADQIHNREGGDNHHRRNSKHNKQERRKSESKPNKNTHTDYKIVVDNDKGDNIADTDKEDDINFEELKNRKESLTAEEKFKVAMKNIDVKNEKAFEKAKIKLAKHLKETKDNMKICYH